MPYFEYPLVIWRGERGDTNATNVELGMLCVKNDTIIDVDSVVLPDKRWLVFDINNRLGVSKMMSMDEKARIKQAYDRHDDGYEVACYLFIYIFC